eukprot:6310139-Karenia_brevis.AAC.1
MMNVDTVRRRLSEDAAFSLYGKRDRGLDVSNFDEAIFLMSHNRAVWTYTTQEAWEAAPLDSKDGPPASWAEYFLDNEALVKVPKKGLHLNAGR